MPPRTPMSPGAARKAAIRRQRVKGMYQKWGTWYWQPPTPKDGSGRPRPINLKTHDYVVAVEEVSKRMVEDRTTEAARRGTLNAILPIYHSRKRGDKKPTVRSRTNVLENFSKRLNNPRIEDITPEMMLDWIEAEKKRIGKKKKKVLSPASVKSYLIAVRAFLNWAREEGYIREDPARNLKRHAFLKRTKVQSFFTEEQREQILATKMPDHVRLMLLLGFFAGLRYQEMLALNPKWIWIAPDWTKGSISVQDTPITMSDGTTSTWQPKDVEKRTVPMHPRLLEFFKAYGNPEPWTIMPSKVTWSTKPPWNRYNARHSLKLVEIAAGVEGLHPHKLRHSFATLLAMKDTPIVTIAGLLGDGIQVTEEHYAGFIPSRDNPLAAL